jgi:hypothetical protein
VVGHNDSAFVHKSAAGRADDSPTKVEICYVVPHGAIIPTRIISIKILIRIACSLITKSCNFYLIEIDLGNVVGSRGGWPVAKGGYHEPSLCSIWLILTSQECSGSTLRICLAGPNWLIFSNSNCGQILDNQSYACSFRDKSQFS